MAQQRALRNAQQQAGRLPQRPKIGTAVRNSDGVLMHGEKDGYGHDMGVIGGGGPGQPMSNPHDFSVFDRAFGGARPGPVAPAPSGPLPAPEFRYDSEEPEYQQPAPAAPANFPQPRTGDGGYGQVSEVRGSSGAIHQVQSQGGMNQAVPGWESMTPSQRAHVLMTMPHNDSGGVDTTPAPVFNSRGESTNAGTGGASTITYDPRRDAQKYNGGSVDAPSYTGDVPQRDLPPGASRGVVIDPRYVTPGASNIGVGYGDGSAMSPSAIHQQATAQASKPGGYEEEPGFEVSKPTSNFPTPIGPPNPDGYTYVNGVPPLPPEPGPTSPATFPKPNGFADASDSASGQNPPAVADSAAGHWNPAPVPATAPGQTPSQNVQTYLSPMTARPQVNRSNSAFPTPSTSIPGQILSTTPAVGNSSPFTFQSGTTPNRTPAQNLDDYLSPMTPMPRINGGFPQPSGQQATAGSDSTPLSGPQASTGAMKGTLDLSGATMPRGSMFGAAAQAITPSPGQLLAQATVRPNARATPLPDEDEEEAA